MPRNPATERWLCWLWIGLLMAIHSLIHVHSASVADAARDLYWAWNIARLEAFPVQGPALAHIVHLSPLWYYVLSLPLFFSSAWLGVALWTGLISALQYPLAFLLGRRLAGTACGLVLAGLCALPAWNLISRFNINHVAAVETTTLFILLCTVAWQQTRQPRWLVLLPVAVVAGLHAHPVTWGAALIAATVLAVDVYRRALPWRWLWLGMVLATLPFVPWAIAQSAAGWPDVSAGGSYFSNQSLWANLGGLGALWQGVWISGPHAAWQVILDLGTTGRGLAWLQILIFSCGLLASAWLALTDVRARAVLSGWLVILLASAIIREVTPAWMTGAMYVASATVAAFGVTRLWPLRPGWRLPRRTAAVLAVLPPVVLLTVFVRLGQIGISGDLRLPNQALADVRRHDLTPGESFGYFPAWARDRLGNDLCAESGPLTVHGPASIVLEQSYALEARMRCGKDNLYLGGRTPGRHRFGLSRADAARLQLAQGRDIGSLRFFDDLTVYHPATAIDVPVGDVYPPRTFLADPPQTLVIAVPATAGAWLAVTNLYTVWMPATVEVRLNGLVDTPALETRSARFHHCATCTAEDQWSVRIIAPAPEFVEVVSFVP